MLLRMINMFCTVLFVYVSYFQIIIIITVFVNVQLSESFGESINIC
jgi:hypothetical protein